MYLSDVEEGGETVFPSAKNRAGLRHFLDSFAGTKRSSSSGNLSSSTLQQESSFGQTINDNKSEAKLKAELKSGVDISHTTEARIVYVPFNCFLLMPVDDKLPILLREDLESAFDDLDNIISSLNVTNS
ncbi:hypothetical protein J5N97_020664 [Dioscorea zingiberensis]|uniref:Uncharacterized protein n=1 Tax=Dioscorea zingiberensis TaxID=325984 RepID=A0A9D5HDW2_9LILI|nr:hypothetical protein J5N97_020664 [Dioscorea zingiberensis]